jgi:hypothetical protein
VTSVATSHSTSPSPSPPSHHHGTSSTTKILAGVFTTLALLLLLTLCALAWLLARRRRRRRLARDEDAAADVPAQRHSWHLVGGDDEKLGMGSGVASVDNVAMAGVGARGFGERRRGSMFDPTPAFLPLMHPQQTYIPSDPRYAPQPPSPMEVYYSTPVTTTFASAGAAAAAHIRGTNSNPTASADSPYGPQYDPFGDDTEIMEVRRGEDDAAEIGAGAVGAGIAGVGAGAIGAGAERVASPRSMASSTDTLSSASAYQHRPGYGPEHDPDYAFGGYPPSPGTDSDRATSPPPRRSADIPGPSMASASASASRPGSAASDPYAAATARIRGGQLSPGAASASSYYGYGPSHGYEFAPFQLASPDSPTSPRARRLPDPPVNAMPYAYGPFSPSPSLPTTASYVTAPSSSSHGHGYARQPSSSQGHEPDRATYSIAEDAEPPPRRMSTGSAAGYASWFNRRPESQDAERLLPPPPVLPDRFGPRTGGTDASTPVKDASDYFSARDLRVANQ